MIFETHTHVIYYILDNQKVIILLCPAAGKLKQLC